VLFTTGYVGLATMLAAAVLPLWLLVRGDASLALLAFTAGLAIFIVYTHRANVRRLLAGTESRWEKAMLLRRARRAP
jgi:glycerol-3-phosphate acyltransferase PlsY